MTLQFTVSPDFTPDHLSGWFIFNTWLQRTLDLPVHLQIYDDFHSQREAIRTDAVDLIYANPYDAAMLVRDKGFRPLVKPESRADEALIAVSAESEYHHVEDLKPGIRLAITEDPDVHMMGMIMLEPADLDAGSVQTRTCDGYVLVAKELLRRNSDAGIFLVEAYDDLSSVIRNQLRVLVRSHIHVVHHSLMLGPRLAGQRELLLDALVNMHSCEKGRGVLEALKFSRWEAVDDEEMEFMIDLVDTLMT
ncbi:phosphate/phosphite/phosphonate ABC transporter substrate-binding protein [Methylococcus sp. EFPC2]|uniref:phosphate/phosphite/phosphonate ABC transporter substrate-binding protein n=1 Tax=Methylococcus sp. EFPC2 TaxID=2812648 RepID=UPI001966E145|nr:phosphate/phosphite/phosphonate ABC transporter substrate-binding protein [Methylococcus sp. EFPC2]QSA96265.1 phosphate/phosphite/phosphonate ABC transporter substrate-binding protein [Methylococcus sp. EFPC2]